MAGSNKVAYDVGDSGEKNGVSWPMRKEVLSQSRLIPAVRSLTSPAVTPYAVVGFPPPKSTDTLAELRAPKILGPVASTPSNVWRKVAPVLPSGDPGNVGNARLGKS
jgi:hypothetical protein